MSTSVVRRTRAIEVVKFRIQDRNSRCRDCLQAALTTRMLTRVVFTTIVILLTAVTEGESVTCYSCGAGNDDVSDCVTSPEEYHGTLNPVDCGPNSRCLTYKQTYKDTSGIYFLRRSCAAPTDDEGCVSDSVYTTCKHVCQDDNCNGRDETVVVKRAKKMKVKKNVRKPRNPAVMPRGEDNSTLCYSCTYNYHPEADDSCITDPANVQTANTVACPHDGRVCMIFRQWDIAEQVIRSFHRGCTTIVTTGCVTDNYFETCYYYCDEDLCNDMDATPTTTITPTMTIPPTTTITPNTTTTIVSTTTPTKTTTITRTTKTITTTTTTTTITEACPESYRANDAIGLSSALNFCITLLVFAVLV